LFVFIVAIFSLQISLNRMINSQKREIGIALSLGESRGRLLGFFLTYSLLIGFLSSLFSTLGGWLFGQSMDKLNQLFYPLPDWQNPIIFKAFYPAWIFCILSAFIAALIPAVRASQLLPIKAIRSDPTSDSKNGKMGKRIQRIVTEAFAWSTTWKMSIRNLFRSRKRTLSTILGFGLSVGLVLGTIGVFSSLDHVVSAQQEETQNWDVQIELASPVPLSLLHTEIDILNENFDISRVYFGMQYFTSLELNSEEELLQLVSYDNYSCEEIKVIAGRFPSQSGEILLSSYFAADHGIALHDNITLQHWKMENATIIFTNSTFTVTGFHERSIKVIGFTTWDTMQTTFNIHNSSNFVYLRMKSVDKSAFQADVYEIPIVQKIVFADELRDEYDEVFVDFKDLMMLIQYICYAVGLGMITLTSLISRSEREREIGTMATLGSTDWQIFSVMVLENLILACFGILFGFGLAWSILKWILVPLMANMFDAIVILAFIPQTMWWNTFLTSLVLSIVAQLPLWFQLHKIDLAKATKVRDF
ncbi:MAG: ABC transporter permease, partial [Promethearchaeota archaeon]